jgi:subtilisin family serine protease
MLPPPQGRPLHAQLSSAGLLRLVLVALATGCGGDSLEPQPRGTTIALKAGDVQNAAAGSAVPIAPSVTVTDADANPVAGVPVTFQVTSGGGSVTPATPINTDAQGTAAVTSWTLGSTPGSNTLSASAAGATGSPVVFTATGLVAATISGTITVSNDLLSARTPGPHLGSRAFPASSSRRALRQPTHAPNELIVRFRPRSVGAPLRRGSAMTMRSSAAAVGSEIRARMASLLSDHAATLMGVSPAISSARVRVKNPADIGRVAAALRMNPAVATVERSGIMWSAVASEITSRSASRLTASNDPLNPFQAWHYEMIDLPEAWSLTTGSASVVVAVISDGIRFDHPDMAANLTSDGYDFASNPDELPLCSGGSLGFSGDGDGYDPDPTTPTSYLFEPGGCGQGPEEIASVGLGEAGIIGAVGNNGIGVAGINWAVRIRPIRMINVYGFGADYDLAQALLYAAGLPADDGAGGTVLAPTASRIIQVDILFDQDIAIVRDAVTAATDAGALLISGAGSTGSSDPVYPAAYPEVMAVSGVGPDKEPPEDSSFGPAIAIAAPGGDFLDGDFSFGVGTTFWDFVAGEPIYALATGTSVAASHVAGVAALLLAQEPGLTASELRSRLTDYAVDAGSPGRDDRYGAGIVNARNSLARNLGPPRQLHARLYDALSGGIVQTAAVAGDGSYSFTVTAGSYQVFAGQDESGDGLIGLPGRRWGAFGGLARPSRIDVSGAGSHQASFAVGFPSESEPNETLNDANALPVGGYLSGVVSAPRGGDNDVFRVLIAQAGEYTFETSGVNGACGFALEEDTTLGLYAPDESAIQFSDDIDAAALNFCSRITTTLQPGTYYLRVQGVRGGRYRVEARSGP